MAQHISWSQGCSTSLFISKSILQTSTPVWTMSDNSNRRSRKNKYSNSMLNLAGRVCTTVQPIYHEDIRIVNIGLCFFPLFFLFLFYFILFTISLELGFNVTSQLQQLQIVTSHITLSLSLLHSHMITIEDSRTIMLYSMFYIC